MKLTTRQRQVLELKEKGLTHEQIAKKLGISKGTSEQTYHQAKLRLKAD